MSGYFRFEGGLEWGRRRRPARLRCCRLGMIMLEFLALAHESRAVEDDEQRTAGMHRRGPDGRHFTQCGERHAADNESHTEQEVLVDHSACALRKLHEEREPAQVV